ncbi:MAG: thiamine pyrophosphate-binding protein [Gammaproteobacteria bacterium]|nr:thiamine pyrophosphate-binding protein [Gammaproteobacteria bacterium]
MSAILQQISVEPITASKPLEIGDLLVAYLEQLGVEYVFGIPGGAIEPLYNALARSARRGSVRAIVARHETGGAFMAHGYAQNTGRLGVCCGTSGPGATNLITGVSSAYESRVPMLVITAQTAITHFGRDAFQESSCTGVNVLGMFEYCTAYNTLISHVEQFEHKLCAAIITAFRESRPVHISIPVDIFRAPANIKNPSYNLENFMQQDNLLDQVAVDKLKIILAEAKKPVFLIGESAAEGIGHIAELASRLNAPMISTPLGKGLVNAYHSLYRGIFGVSGHQEASDLLDNPDVDVIIAIGTTLGESASNSWDPQLLRNKKLIHVDARWSHFMHTPMASLHVHGRLSTILTQLLEDYPVNSCSTSTLTENDNLSFSLIELYKCYEENKLLNPQRLMYELPKKIPVHTLYLADTGNSVYWAAHYLHPIDRRMSGARSIKGGNFQTGMEFGSMGWAIGAAIGAALGNNDIPVVALVGDGSWLMSGQELTVAVQESLNIIFIVLNDGALGTIKHGQRLAGAEQYAYEISFVDFAKMAEAMGARGITINTTEDWIALDFANLLQESGPLVIDARIDGEQVPPISSRMKALGTVKAGYHDINE